MEEDLTYENEVTINGKYNCNSLSNNIEKKKRRNNV